MTALVCCGEIGIGEEADAVVAQSGAGFGSDGSGPRPFGHLHNRQERPVPNKGAGGMYANGVDDIGDVHHRLWHHAPVGLFEAMAGVCGHVGQGVANIDLAATDVESSAIEADRAGEAGHRVLGGRVGSGDKVVARGPTPGRC